MITLYPKLLFLSSLRYQFPKLILFQKIKFF
nr:MAG TPA: hypothetical protein [Caudoviricetes sp.]